MIPASAKTLKGDLIIHDPFGTFCAWLYLIIPLYSSLLFLMNLFRFSDGWFLCLLGLPVSLAFGHYLKLVALAKGRGTTLSISDQCIYYPGGSISAESINSYFTSSYWLQATRIHKTNFDEISQLSLEVEETFYSKARRNRNHHEYIKPAYKYGVGIQGLFGSARIFFRDEQKCQQLYAVLRQHLNAGTPVFDARL